LIIVKIYIKHSANYLLLLLKVTKKFIHFA
jgi:hypothetical protein